MVGKASQNWKIRRLLDLQIVVRLKIGDWRIRGHGGALSLAAGGTEGSSEDGGQFVSLLLERPDSRDGLQPGSPDYAKPQFALVSFFGHYGELRNENRARITAAGRPIVRCDRGAGVNELPRDLPSSNRVGKRLAEFHDTDGEIFGSGFEPFGCF